MSADSLVPDASRFCCVCGEPAEVVINHPEKGDRTVCRDHVNGHEVIGDV